MAYLTKIFKLDKIKLYSILYYDFIAESGQLNQF